MEPPAPLHVFSDFDGTITEPDTLKVLVAELGGGAAHYRETDRLIRAGELTLRAALARDVGTIRAPFATAAALLRARVTIDPGFAPFARWCASRGIPLTVLSGGFTEIVDLFLGRETHPEVEVRANRFHPGTWECAFRDDSPSGHDKAAAVRAARAGGVRTVLVGDGVSDWAPAAEADLVFARRGRNLAEHCRHQGIPCEEYESFDDVRRRLEIAAHAAA